MMEMSDPNIRLAALEETDPNIRLTALEGTFSGRIPSAATEGLGSSASTAQNDATNAHREQQVVAEQVRLLYHQSPLAVGASFVAGLILACVTVDAVKSALVWGWVAALALVLVLRLFLCLLYRRHRPSTASAERWGRWHTLAIAGSGLVWGMGAILLYVSGDLSHHLWLTLALVGVTACSISVTSHYAPAGYAFAPLALLPQAAHSLLVGDLPHLITAGVDLLLLAVAIIFSRDQNRLLVRSLRSHFQNLELIDELQREKLSAYRTREEALSASRAKTHFLAAASHDLRQPLHALSLFSIALRNEPTRAGREKIVDSINDAVEALEGLFNKLLDISKLDAGFVEPAVATFSIAQLIDRVTATFTPAAKDKGLVLSAACDNSTLVRCDPVLLEGILSNLVVNAINYTEKGHVFITCHRTSVEEVALEVRDTGIGIDPSEQTRIFDEFYQVGNPERDRKKGLGLGLAIVRRLVRLLQIRLTVESAPGLGSTFRLHLAVGQPHEMAQPAQGDNPDPHPALPEDLLVVVIDDEAEIRDGMQTLLRQWGWQVVAVADGQEAITALAGRLPNLILADYRLRAGVKGTEAVAQICREVGEDIPAILITGDTAADRIQEARASGYHLMHKPVRPVRLRALITRVLLQTAE